MSEDERVKKLLSQLREGKYVVPSWTHEEFTQDQIDDFVKRIFGIPWALISERSLLSDFCEGPWPLETEPKPDVWITLPGACAKIKAEYGITVDGDGGILDVLRQIRANDGTKGAS